MAMVTSYLFHTNVKHQVDVPDLGIEDRTESRVHLLGKYTGGVKRDALHVPVKMGGKVVSPEGLSCRRSSRRSRPRKRDRNTKGGSFHEDHFVHNPINDRIKDMRHVLPPCDPFNKRRLSSGWDEKRNTRNGQSFWPQVLT